jgi:formylglycine-generating enzyme required for sulfatase activity
MSGLVFELSPPESRRRLFELARFLSRGTRRLSEQGWQRLQATALEQQVPVVELERILDELGVQRPSVATKGVPERQETRHDPPVPAGTTWQSTVTDSMGENAQFEPVVRQDPGEVRRSRDEVGGALDPLLRNMVRVVPGEFSMGSHEDERGRFENEGPQHQVIITRPFLVCTVPVHQGLWQMTMGYNPSAFAGKENPVERVSWFDAAAFCNELSRTAGLPDAYVFEDTSGHVGERDFSARVRWAGPGQDGFRLLSEAEWEFCARGGVSGRSTGQRAFLSRQQWAASVAWFSENSGSTTHPVGGKLPCTRLGLRDVLGNVAEWVWDVYEPYPGQPMTTGVMRGLDRMDPVGPRDSSTAVRCVRGGSWASPIRGIREAFRGALPPHRREKTVGLRVARSIVRV